MALSSLLIAPRLGDPHQPERQNQKRPSGRNCHAKGDYCYHRDASRIANYGGFWKYWTGNEVGGALVSANHDRRMEKAMTKSPKQAVIVHIPLSDDANGTQEEIDHLLALEEELEAAMPRRRAASHCASVSLFAREHSRARIYVPLVDGSGLLVLGVVAMRPQVNRRLRSINSFVCFGRWLRPVVHLRAARGRVRGLRKIPGGARALSAPLRTPILDPKPRRF